MKAPSSTLHLVPMVANAINDALERRDRERCEVADLAAHREKKARMDVGGGRRTR